MKKHFNKEPVMTKNFTKCWICDMVFIDGDVKVRDQCHITWKYRGSANRDRNIKGN